MKRKKDFLRHRIGLFFISVFLSISCQKNEILIPASLLGDHVLDLKINDYNMRNPKGEYKVIGMFSKVYYLSSSPAQIRMEIDSG